MDQLISRESLYAQPCDIPFDAQGANVLNSPVVRKVATALLAKEGAPYRASQRIDWMLTRNDASSHSLWMVLKWHR